MKRPPRTIYSKRISALVTPQQRKAFESRGGSKWIRELIQQAMEG